MLKAKNNIRKYLSISLFLLMNSILVVNSSAQEMETPLPSYRVDPNPIYPKASLRYEEEGKAMVRVVLNVNGEIESVSLHKSSGFPRLDEAAIEAVNQAKFNPFVASNQKNQEAFILPIRFALEPLPLKTK
jgi:TonB family protein